MVLFHGSQAIAYVLTKHGKQTHLTLVLIISKHQKRTLTAVKNYLWAIMPNECNAVLL